MEILAWIGLYYNGCKMGIFQLQSSFLVYQSILMVLQTRTFLFSPLIYRYRLIDFYLFQCFLIHYCILVLKFSLVWPVRASSSSHLGLSHMPLSYFWASLSGRTRCSRFILCLSCLRCRISHFSKKPLFLSVQSIVCRNQVVGTRCVHCIKMSLLLWNVCI